jgi:pyruvate-formate lyase-activating enzyme
MAQTLSVEEVLTHVRKAAMFIEGITVSGGEATTQLPFLVALFSALKSTRRFNTCPVWSTATVCLAKRAGKDFCLSVTGR